MSDTAGPKTFNALAEAGLVDALRSGDDSAFEVLFEKHHTALVRLALMYVSDRAVAEEVAQETWLGVLHGLDRFEGRASLKTWIFTILINRAKTRGLRESRSLPFSALGDADADGPDEPAVAPERFLTRQESAGWAGHWREDPRRWDDLPETRVLSQETLGCIRQAIDALPLNQQRVITLRDVDGFSAEEVCNILEISETNQRVLLHRARSKVRQALEKYLGEALDD